MLKYVDGFDISKKIRQKFKVRVRPFKTAKVRCLVDHVKPAIREENPDHIILHIGTNDIPTDQTPIQICNNIINLASSLKENDIKVTISSIVQRNDEHNHKVLLVNEYLGKICSNVGFEFISHDNINLSIHLNTSELHVNRKGNLLLSSISLI